jgi:hypothetical protein
METEGKVNEKPQTGQAGKMNLREARKWLGRNEINEVAADCGVSRQTVTNVIAGRATNYIIAEKILTRAEKNKSLKQRADAI